MSNLELPNKLNLAQLPTPIQKLEYISQLIHRDVYVKRDDFTHLEMSGNKLRKLEYLLAEAKRKGSKTVFTAGAVQSNHVRATAIACAKLGLGCVVFLKETLEIKQAAPKVEGNLYLTTLAGAKVVWVDEQELKEPARVFLKHADEFKIRDGVLPFFIAVGGSQDFGALGYFSAFEEIQKQSLDMGIQFDSIVCATGSGGTHAGLILGRNYFDANETTRIIAFDIIGDSNVMIEKAKTVALAAIQRFRLPISLGRDDIDVIGGYVGIAYAKPTVEQYQFLAEVFRREGILFDPVYAGKALFGLVKECLNQNTRFGQKILFLNSGGFASCFVDSHREGMLGVLVSKDS